MRFLPPALYGNLLAATAIINKIMAEGGSFRHFTISLNLGQNISRGREI